MRPLNATITLLPLLSLLAACDPGPKSLGSLEGGTDTGEGDYCSPPGVDLEFELVGLDDAPMHDLTLTCTASVSSIASGHAVALGNCVDAQANPHADVELLLSGDWSEPLVDGEEVELRYLRFSVGEVVDQMVHDYDSRWLSLRSPGGQAPLALVAVDAIATLPVPEGDHEFDHGPLAIGTEPLDCPPVEGVACAPLERGALIVTLDDQPFAVAEGTEATAEVGSEGYRVWVEQTHALETPCAGDPSAWYEFGIVALPSS